MVTDHEMRMEALRLFEENEKLRRKNDELIRALKKVKSYNVDIAAGRINYRPHDHIQVIDDVLNPIHPIPLEATCNHWPGQKRCEVCGMGRNES